VTFYQILEDYLQHTKVYGKGRTVDQVRFHGDKLADHFGTQDMDTLSSTAVDEFIQGKIRKGWAPATVNGALRVYKAAMRHSGRGCKVRMMKVTKKLPTVLNKAQVDLLVGTAEEGSDEHLAILIAAHAGLRHREILHLKGSDVDYLKGFIRVTAKPEVNWTPKSHEEREIPLTLNGRLMEALAWRASRRGGPNRWLFPGWRGRPRCNLQCEVQDVFKRSGLYVQEDKPGLHMLRRTWASRMLESGVDINTVRELGGWSNLDILLRYLRSSDEAKRRAVELIE
jgi:integrase